MNKSDICSSVAKATGLSVEKAEEAVKNTFETMKEGLLKGEQITLVGFGTFAPKTRAARDGRNPATGKPIRIPERTSVTFRPAAALKDIK